MLLDHSAPVRGRSAPAIRLAVYWHCLQRQRHATLTNPAGPRPLRLTSPPGGEGRTGGGEKGGKDARRGGGELKGA